MTNSTLDLSLQSAQSSIANFLDSGSVYNSLLTTFGDRFSLDTGISLLSALATEDINLPIEVIASAEINHANGAYSRGERSFAPTIYLSAELLATGDVDAVTKTLLEETGHYIDDLVNSSDAPGDEGAIFAAFVLGEELNNEPLELLQAEDDTAIVNIDGEELEIEQDGIIYVNLNASGDNDGSSWDNAYTDLQDALANATTGDAIWVADGTYKPTEGQDRSISFQLKSGVEIYGGFAGGESELEARDIENNQTILSGNLGVANDDSDNSYHVVDASNTNSEALLDGFFITGGNANGEDSFGVGGGIYSEQGNATFSNLTIFGNTTEGSGGGFYTTEPTSPEVESSHQLTNVIFQNNTTSADSGGGLFNNGSGLVLENVQFIENTADQSGGGLANRVSNAVILNDVEFINNQANSGGGLFNNDSRDDDLRLTNVRFIDNQAERFGGALYNFAGSPILTDVEFINNTSNEEGGAIRVGLGSPVITNALFRSNSAEESGGAIFVSTDERETRIINSVFDRNTAPSGGAVYIDESNTSIINSTFANNEAGDGAAIFSLLEGEERPTVTNSIFYDNQGNAIANEAGTTVVTNSIVQGGYEGDGNLDTDPLFVDSENGDLRIVENSPGVDAGDNEVVDDSDPTNPPQDIAGNPRIFNDVVDLGAYEYSLPYIAINNTEVEVNVTSGEPTEDAEATFVVRITDSAGETISNDSEITLNYQVADNTAIADEDYLSSSGTITFAAGENEKTVTVPVLSNTDSEEDESFYLDLSDVTGDILDFDSRGVATITNVSEPEPEPEPEELETIELFRFRNTTFETGTYVFVGAEERDAILEDDNLRQTFSLDGLQDDGTVNPAFKASLEQGEDLIPFYRLASLDILGTFLFVSTGEYDAIFANDSAQRDKWDKQGLNSDGEDIPEFYLLDGSADRGNEFNRFQNTQNGTFLYAGEAETNAIENDPNLSSLFNNQGVAFESLT